MKPRYTIFLLILLSLALLAVACSSGAPANNSPLEAEVEQDVVEPTKTQAPTPSPTATLEPKPDYLVAEGDPNYTYIAPFPVAISMDGDLSDWDGVPLVSMGNPENTAVTFAAAII